MTLIAIATVLASGAVFASLTILSHQVARQFLAASRAEVEVRQYAESLFLSRELFATKKRTGILMLVSLFERRVIIIPDKGLHDRLTADILQRIIASMTPLLKRNEIKRAFEAGLERISHTLGTRTRGKGKNELPDDIIEEKGL
jgi:putative membrane protein